MNIHIKEENTGLRVSAPGLRELTIPGQGAGDFYINPTNQGILRRELPWLPQCEDIAGAKGEKAFRYTPRTQAVGFWSILSWKSSYTSEILEGVKKFSKPTNGEPPNVQALRKNFLLPDFKKHPELFRLYDGKLSPLWGVEIAGEPSPSFLVPGEIVKRVNRKGTQEEQNLLANGTPLEKQVLIIGKSFDIRKGKTIGTLVRLFVFFLLLAAAATAYYLYQPPHETVDNIAFTQQDTDDGKGARSVILEATPAFADTHSTPWYGWRGQHGVHSYKWEIISTDAKTVVPPVTNDGAKVEVNLLPGEYLASVQVGTKGTKSGAAKTQAFQVAKLPELPPLEVSFQQDDVENNDGARSVLFTASPEVEGASYVWEITNAAREKVPLLFGGSETKSLQTFLAPGIYTVNVKTEKKDFKASAQKVEALNVVKLEPFPLSAIDFKQGDEMDAEGRVVSFSTASTSKEGTYTWNIALKDGAALDFSKNKGAVVETRLPAGTYNVEVKAVGKGFKASATQSLEAVVTELPVLELKNVYIASGSRKDEKGARDISFSVTPLVSDAVYTWEIKNKADDKVISQETTKNGKLTKWLVPGSYTLNVSAAKKGNRAAALPAEVVNVTELPATPEEVRKQREATLRQTENALKATIIDQEKAQADYDKQVKVVANLDKDRDAAIEEATKTKEDAEIAKKDADSKTDIALAAAAEAERIKNQSAEKETAARAAANDAEKDREEYAKKAKVANDAAATAQSAVDDANADLKVANEALQQAQKDYEAAKKRVEEQTAAVVHAQQNAINAQKEAAGYRDQAERVKKLAKDLLGKIAGAESGKEYKQLIAEAEKYESMAKSCLANATNTVDQANKNLAIANKEVEDTKKKIEETKKTAEKEALRVSGVVTAKQKEKEAADKEAFAANQKAEEAKTKEKESLRLAQEANDEAEKARTDAVDKNTEKESAVAKSKEAKEVYEKAVAHLDGIGAQTDRASVEAKKRLDSLVALQNSVKELIAEIEKIKKELETGVPGSTPAAPASVAPSPEAKPVPAAAPAKQPPRAKKKGKN